VCYLFVYYLFIRDFERRWFRNKTNDPYLFYTFSESFHLSRFDSWKTFFWNEKLKEREKGRIAFEDESEKEKKKIREKKITISNQKHHFMALPIFLLLLLLLLGRSVEMPPSVR
jgi:hypothetical protein